MLLLANCIFYGMWNWKCLGLIFITVGVDYLVAFAIKKNTDKKKRKWLLTFSIVANLGLLGFFKYYDFFITSLHDLFSLMGVTTNLHTLDLILPWGISFYTFQSMSYTIDVYYEELEPVANFYDFALFVTYFPHLVAGPILRAVNFLPQVLNKRIIICRIDTERPEVLEHHGIMCKDPDELSVLFNKINQEYEVNAKCPFGNGYSYKKIIELLYTNI